MSAPSTSATLSPNRMNHSLGPLDLEALNVEYVVGEDVLFVNKGEWHKAQITKKELGSYPDDNQLKVAVYLIHYTGWSKKYDEWVMGDSMMKDTFDNKVRADQENERAKRMKTAEKRSYKTRKEKASSSKLPVVSKTFPEVVSAPSNSKGPYQSIIVPDEKRMVKHGGSHAAPTQPEVVITATKSSASPEIPVGNRSVVKRNEPSPETSASSSSSHLAKTVKPTATPLVDKSGRKSEAEVVAAPSNWKGGHQSIVLSNEKHPTKPGGPNAAHTQPEVITMKSNAVPVIPTGSPSSLKRHESTPETLSHGPPTQFIRTENSAPSGNSEPEVETVEDAHKALLMLQRFASSRNLVELETPLLQLEYVLTKEKARELNLRIQRLTSGSVAQTSGSK